jgi:hypothetical protein
VDGWLLLDPARDYALRSFEVRMTWSADPKSVTTTSGMVRYPERGSSGMFPEELTVVSRYGHDGIADERVVHFAARRRNADVPAAAEFTLAHYGLGDYPWPAPPERVAAPAKASGPNQLVVRTPVIHHDRPAPKESVDVSFELTNLGTTAARVVGMRIGCAAIIPSDDLPCRLEPGQTKRLTLRLNDSSEMGDTKTPLYLYTTAPGQAEIDLTIVGHQRVDKR